MPEPLYRIGEPRGPFTVVEDTFEILEQSYDPYWIETHPGKVKSVEYVKDSSGNSAWMYVEWGDTSYHPVCPRSSGFNVLVPYTWLDKRTVEAVEHLPVIFADVSGSNWDYWRVLCDWWVPTDDLIIIEHDVAPRPDVFTEFEECQEPWCLFTYDNFEGDLSAAIAWQFALGCTRFRKELIEAVPNALMDVQERWKDWHYTCDGIGYNLTKAGFFPHFHWPAINHHRFIDENGNRPAVDCGTSGNESALEFLKQHDKETSRNV